MTPRGEIERSRRDPEAFALRRTLRRAVWTIALGSVLAVLVVRRVADGPSTPSALPASPDEAPRLESGPAPSPRVDAPSPADPAPAVASAPRHEPLRVQPLARPAPGTGKLYLSFKLDPRMTSGVHMGGRWVSPPRYTTSGTGAVFTVAVRAQGVDARGEPVRGSPTWLSSEPDMVAISSDEAREVTLTILRPGDSAVAVTHGAATKTLGVRATQAGATWKVEITQ